MSGRFNALASAAESEARAVRATYVHRETCSQLASTGARNYAGAFATNTARYNMHAGIAVAVLGQSGARPPLHAGQWHGQW
jgi:hypothetical protein